MDNFKGTHYANGDPIPHVTDNDEWISLSTGAYCYYDNDKKNADTYGALYNWWAANDPRGLIVGWHTPSDDDWDEMSFLYLTSRFDTRGQKLKEPGTAHWLAPNEGTTNESGFTALPAGARGDVAGKFWYLHTKTYFICSSGMGSCYWTRTLYYDKSEFGQQTAILKIVGASIRLIKSN